MQVCIACKGPSSEIEPSHRNGQGVGVGFGVAVGVGFVATRSTFRSVHVQTFAAEGSKVALSFDVPATLSLTVDPTIFRPDTDRCYEKSPVGVVIAAARP